MTVMLLRSDRMGILGGGGGQRHFIKCIAWFLQNLHTFLVYCCSTNYYACCVAAKARMLSLRSIEIM